MKYPFPVVEVTWLDAGTAHGWEGNDEVEAKPFEVMTVGFLLRDQPDCLMVASTTCADKSSNSRITIPRGMVLSLRVLKGPRPVKLPSAAPRTDPPPAAASTVDPLR